MIFGKRPVIEMAVATFLARGHLLIVDVPGTGKTMLARALAKTLDASFRRIQFTPDTLPTDVLGGSIYRPGDGSFEFVPGPIFSEVLLADEINRTSPRTQSSLLEAMEERQVTIEGKTHRLPDFFLVVATQNPIEFEGTFPLPEAQLDRFAVRLEIGYPDALAEESVLLSQTEAHPIEKVEQVSSTDAVRELQSAVRAVEVSDSIRRYCVDLANATRSHNSCRLGVSPRGTLALRRISQAHAFIRGSSFVTPDDVKTVCPYVFAHRILIDPHRELSGVNPLAIIEEILNTVEVPVASSGR